MRVGLLLIATNKYVQFVEPLLASMREFFLTGHEVTAFCFTNMDHAPEGTTRIHIEHKPWPGPTLYRYHNFSNARQAFASMDYLYYCDVDMKFVAPVGNEVLGELVATNHPGFYNKPRQAFSYERRRQSIACVRPNEGSHYFAGGFNGGKKDVFLKMSDTIRGWVDMDQCRRITAVWHDESYQNKYMIQHHPTVILSPSYCYPESWDLPFEKKLLALDKNHEEVRS